MTKLPTFTLIILFGLLFVAIPPQLEGRIFDEVMEFGHFILFSAFVFLALKTKYLINRSLVFQFLLVIVLCGVVGLATEVLQIIVGRSFQLSDIGLDLLGGIAGFFIFKAHRICKGQKPIAERWLLCTYVALFCGVLLVATRHISFAVFDEWQVSRQFPILSNFETPLELKRWHYSTAHITRSSQKVKSGEFSMKAHFTPGLYPRISLEHFIHDWSHYKTLIFYIYNPQINNLELVLKIYDDLHVVQAFQHNDRYNHTLTIKPGWNEFKISLNQIKHAPFEREMVLESIRSLSLFFVKLNQPVTLYLDDLQLSIE